MGPTARLSASGRLRRRHALALVPLLGAVACGTTVPRAIQLNALGGRSVDSSTVNALGTPAGGGSATSPSAGDVAANAPGGGDGTTPDGAVAGGTVGGGTVAAGPGGGNSAGVPVGSSSGGTGSTGTRAPSGTRAAKKPSSASGASAKPGSTARPSKGTAAGSAGAGAPSAAGVTATTINVGITYVGDINAVNSAAGASNVGSGDIVAQNNAIIAYVNAHGGVAGRKLVPDYYEIAAASAQSFDEQEQAACTHFTQDNHDFLVLDSGDATYMKCLRDAGVVVISDDLPELDEADLTSNVFELGSPSFERIAAELTPGLKAQNYFQPWNTLTGAASPTGTTKIGVLYYSGLGTNAVTNILVPALKKAGYAVDVAAVTPPNSLADEGNVSTGASAAELNFAADGVDHVIVFDGNGSLTLYFMEAASSQNYLPRYGGDSANGFTTILGTGSVPSSQFVGSMGYSWFSEDDLDATRDPDNGPYSSAQRRSCVAIFTASGNPYASRDDERGQLALCDQLFAFQQIAGAALAAGPLTADTFATYAGRVGTGFNTALSFGMDFTPTQHDPIATAYDEQYQTACGCYEYVGNVHPIP